MQNTTFVLILSSNYVSGGFPLVGCRPFLFICRCPIIIFLGFSRCFLMIFFVRSGQVFRKPCLISVRRLAVVGMKSYACKYWASSVFEVCARMLFTTFSDCCVPRGTSHIPGFLLLITFIVSYPFFRIDIFRFSSVMVHPSSLKTSNDIN